MFDELGVSVSAVDLPEDIARRLDELGPELEGRVALLLPTELRNGTTYYKPDDMAALRTAREAALDMAYLHDREERRFIHEYSAGWILDFALAVGQNLTADGLVAIGNYVLTRARSATSRKEAAGLAERVPTRVAIGQVTRDRDGSITLSNLRFEGPAQGVADAIREVLAPIGDAAPSVGQIEKRVSDAGSASEADASS